MAKLSHPNVGAIFDVGVHQGQVFLAMEHLPGGTLSQWLEDAKRFCTEALGAGRVKGAMKNAPDPPTPLPDGSDGTGST